MTASEAQVAAAMEALKDHALVGIDVWSCECKCGGWPSADGRDHGDHQAQSVADAVVAAGPDPATIRRGRYCGCGWCCANNPPGVVPGDGHRNCSASKAAP